MIWGIYVFILSDNEQSVRGVWHSNMSNSIFNAFTNLIRCHQHFILKWTKRQYSGQMGQIFKTVKTIEIQPVRQTEYVVKYKVRKMAKRMSKHHYYCPKNS